MPLYKLLKKSDTFTWMPKAQDALDALKKMLTLVLVLVAPMPNEPWLLYVAATTQVVSTVLVVEHSEQSHI